MQTLDLLSGIGVGLAAQMGSYRRRPTNRWAFVDGSADPTFFDGWVDRAAGRARSTSSEPEGLSQNARGVVSVSTKIDGGLSKKFDGGVVARG